MDNVVPVKGDSDAAVYFARRRYEETHAKMVVMDIAKDEKAEHGGENEIHTQGLQ